VLLFFFSMTDSRERQKREAGGRLSPIFTVQRPQAGETGWNYCGFQLFQSRGVSSVKGEIQ
jgi:hypothetical protein